ncbi:MAG: galactokinase [Myxococcota bacterium]
MYGRPSSFRADAPGRVNLIGEHTDYNEGFVLPLAIPQRTRVEIGPRNDATVRAWTSANPDDAPVTWQLGAEAPTGAWSDYVQGVVFVLLRAGHPLGGFDVRVESDVPVGAGLSSSAALAIALLRGLRDTFALTLSDLDLARLGQAAENDFVGAPVGILDLMASSLAGERTALFLDTRTLAWRSVPLPAGLGIAVVDSGITHAHATGDYRLRRDECTRAAALLGVPALRDADLAGAGGLPPPLDGRVRHVVTEDARVLEAVEAIERGDLPRLGQLFLASHASMRDDFAVSLPPIDRLVEVAAAHPAVFGARLTGGGFGGSIVLACRAGAEREAARTTAERWARETGGTPRVHVPWEVS